ncbi:hypothetical protein [Jannaschia sp. 2305UL9-9]|uniref:hypothetical protein n=1 Tax=Jannaschia sp. 2305UL9-9 TaxID=3121638 RepID=UPI003527E17E
MLSQLIPFPWQTLAGVGTTPEQYAISTDGETVVMQLPVRGGLSAQIVSYDVSEGTFATVLPVLSLASQNTTTAVSFASDAGDRVALTTGEALVAADVDGAVDVYVIGGPDDYTLIQPEGVARNIGVTLGAFSGDGNHAVIRAGDEIALIDIADGTQVDLDAMLGAAGFDVTYGNNNDRRPVAISDDGDRVAVWLFQEQVIYDHSDGSLTTLEEIAPGFTLGAANSTPVLSGNGRYLFFYANPVFTDREDGLVRVEIDTGAVDYVYFANDGQLPFSVSDDGRYVAFTTTVPGLTPDDPPDDAFPTEPDVFVRDMETGALTRIAPDAADGALPARFNGADPVISGDGSTLLVSAQLSDVLDFRDPSYGSAYLVDGYGAWLPAVVGTEGADTLPGTDGADVIRGLGGADLLRGFAGDDTLEGGDGADTLDGGAGDDLLRGGTSEADLSDVIFGGAGNDSIEGGYGNDALNGGEGHDTIAGGFGVDTVIGNGGDDVLTGSAFSDLMFGGDGMDFVNGGFGSDRVNGGAGADRFYHLGVLGHGSDWIQDYSAAEGDILVFGGTATAAQFQINRANTAEAGADGVDEAFVIYRPTGQIIWALVDGMGQDEIILRAGGVETDLLA